MSVATINKRRTERNNLDTMDLYQDLYESIIRQEELSPKNPQVYPYPRSPADIPVLRTQQSLPVKKSKMTSSSSSRLKKTPLSEF